ncbi:MAG: dTDP-glucose 4,6-dehydratase [Verrucomicrobiota bacterium]
MRQLSSILLTGGAGFIGSSLARHLLKEEDLERLVVLDKLTYAGDRRNLACLEADPRFRFVEGDVNDEELLKRVFEEGGVTGVFHLAAESHVDRSIEDSRDFIATNVGGTATILEAARHAGASLLHCSTDEVYGPVAAPNKVQETAGLNPTSAYAASKAGADLLVFAAQKTHGQDVLVTRCTNNYGPRQNPEKLVPLLVKRALADERLPIYGNGLQIRDWIHVDDHCEGMIAAWRRGKSGEVYHFAGHCERTNLGMARSVLDALRKPHSLIEHVKDRKGHDVRYALDTEKATMWFGWRPKRKFAEEFPNVIRALVGEGC